MFGTRVSKGKFQVVDVTYNAKGKSTVKEISVWLPVPHGITGIVTSRELVKGTQYEALF